MMDSDQVGATGKCALYHKLGEGGDNGGKNMPPTKHGLADGHEVGNGVIAITNQLFFLLASVTD